MKKISSILLFVLTLTISVQAQYVSENTRVSAIVISEIVSDVGGEVLEVYDSPQYKIARIRLASQGDLAGLRQGVRRVIQRAPMHIAIAYDWEYQVEYNSHVLIFVVKYDDNPVMLSYFPTTNILVATYRRW